jgi:hypothetical protein
MIYNLSVEFLEFVYYLTIWCKNLTIILRKW